jgi:catalase
MASDSGSDGAAAVDVINARFGRHPRTRALHAKGIWARGTFTASADAAAHSRAKHLQGDPIPVLARLSNGGGNPKVPDYAPDVRGLAVKFEIPGAEPTDLVSQSVPKFFSRTSADFLDFIRANTGRSAAIKLPLFLARNPHALLSLPANTKALRPVEGFERCRFYGVHAFRWVAADESATHVRCDWQPELGVNYLGPRDARSRGRDYLMDGFKSELPARWTLDAQIADEEDPVDDPSHHWPGSRRRVDAGTLELTEVIADPELDGGIIVFDPMRLTDGVEPTADPVLRFRPEAYSASVERRAS